MDDAVDFDPLPRRGRITKIAEHLGRHFRVAAQIFILALIDPFAASLPRPRQARPGPIRTE